ncbi:acyltransferase [Aliivibrio salmonicida]|uniref:Chloramphenicol acetyltransferase n=1 Tax=Aliivibrio salmonicida (strain LFI1238) TaxID=316275 RepID=B6EQI7_ALISL|nr:acyltransferase [Aliivibrio salmonicida]AZL86392.1 acyltransferase [Aliivibrio salmonicida]CAQ80960.1 putative O-acetyltransferase [Aliivibrio salmonicida LFI1238]
MAFLTDDELKCMGFKSLGKSVKISDKASIYNCNEIELGDHSRIDDFCVVSGKVKIGRNVHFATHCLVAGGEEGLIFDDFSGLAYSCQIFTRTDDYSGSSMTNPTVPDKYKFVVKKEMRVGRHAIVGAGSIILPGVNLAEGTSIGALSLVRKSTQPWSIYLGNPAKKLKDRKKDLLKLEELYLIEAL